MRHLNIFEKKTVTFFSDGFQSSSESSKSEGSSSFSAKQKKNVKSVKSQNNTLERFHQP